MKLSQTQAFLTGLLVGAAVMVGYNALSATLFSDHHDHDDHTHAEESFHVHADFLVYLDGQQLDFTADQYQSVAGDEKLKDFHLHDNEGTILHRHAERITLGKFFDSIGFTLTQECFTIDAGEEYCSNDENELLLFANGERVADPAGYIFADTDRLLLYYGASENPELQTYLERVTDEACIYSGTCPERGLPPPESCGLTCEI